MYCCLFILFVLVCCLMGWVVMCWLVVNNLVSKTADLGVLLLLRGIVDYLLILWWVCL